MVAYGSQQCGAGGGWHCLYIHLTMFLFQLLKCEDLLLSFVIYDSK